MTETVDNTTSTTTYTEEEVFTTSPIFNMLGGDAPENRADRRRKSKKMRYCKVHKILSRDHGVCEMIE